MEQPQQAIVPTVYCADAAHARLDLVGPELWWEADDTTVGPSDAGDLAGNFINPKSAIADVAGARAQPQPTPLEKRRAPLWIVDAEPGYALWEPERQGAWRRSATKAVKANSGQAAAASPSVAPTEPRDSDLTFTSNIALVSDYRVAGVSSSGRGAALQGEADIDAPHGWSAGIWASTISETAGSNFEVDLYGAKAFDVGDTEFSVGATVIVLPGGDNASVGLLDANVSSPIGPVDATLAARYVWPGQGNVADEDDLYVSLKAESPIGRLGGAPITLGASIGYEEGVFAVEDSKTDWSVSLTAHVANIDVGLSYVDTSLHSDKNGAAGLLLSLIRSF